MCNNFLLPSKDLKLFDVDGLEYLLYSPRGQIYAVNNSFFKTYLDICKGVKSQHDIDQDMLRKIYEYFMETVDKYDRTCITSSEELHLSSLVLNIAGNCNLACQYCFARDGEKFLFGDMDLETAQSAVEFMVNNNPEDDSYHITFFGGEPFLRGNLLGELLPWIEKKYFNKNISYSVTTNGTILSEALINLIKTYKISILISIDGGETQTNRNRPFKDGVRNTFSEIVKNAHRLQKDGINFTYRATVVADEGNLVELATFFETQKVMYHLVFCFPNRNSEFGSNWDVNSLIALKEQFRKLMDFYFQKIVDKEFIYAEFILEKLHSISLRKVIFVPCGSGRNMLSVNADGSLFSCMNYSGLLETTVGSLEKGVVLEKNRYFGAKEVDTTKCSTCEIRYLCGGACEAEKYHCNGKTEQLAESRCQIENILWDEYLRLFQKIKRHNPVLIDNISKHKLIYECV